MFGLRCMAVRVARQQACRQMVTRLPAQPMATGLSKAGLYLKVEHKCTDLAADASLPALGDTADLEQSNENWDLCYDSQVTGKVKHVKLFSLITMSCSLLAAPTIAFFPSEAMSETGRLMLGLATFFLGSGSTLLLNGVYSPFVARAFVSKQNPHILELSMVNSLGKIQVFRMHTNDQTSIDTSRPLSTFFHVPTDTNFYLLEHLIDHPVWQPILPQLFEEDK